MKLLPTILLVNLGTPDKPQIPEVRRYLKEFLMDGRVIDIPSLLRYLLVHGIILRFRPKKSAAAYQKVWTEKGSPLLFHGQDLTTQLRQLLAGKAEVELAMRYGNPSLESVLNKVIEKGTKEIIVLPLYPQYAAATTGSTVAKIYELLGSDFNAVPVTTVPDFFDHPSFIKAFSVVAQETLESFKPDHVLFSYHGLPESHLAKTSSQCLSTPDCCATITAENRYCYRAQCCATSRCLSESLNLANSKWSQAFQSRLGKAEWIKPYTTDQIVALAKQGVKRLAVMCPAFVADCLETIEEIGMEAKQDFIEAGGEDFILIPSLNSHPTWVKAVGEITEKYLS